MECQSFSVKVRGPAPPLLEKVERGRPFYGLAVGLLAIEAGLLGTHPPNPKYSCYPIGAPLIQAQ